MSWLKVDDAELNDDRLLRAGPAARDLRHRAQLFMAANRDGTIRRQVLTRQLDDYDSAVDVITLADRLVALGLWEATEDGYRDPVFMRHNDPAQIEATRAQKSRAGTRSAEAREAKYGTSAPRMSRAEKLSKLYEETADAWDASTEVSEEVFNGRSDDSRTPFMGVHEEPFQGCSEEDEHSFDDSRTERSSDTNRPVPSRPVPYDSRPVPSNGETPPKGSPPSLVVLENGTEPRPPKRKPRPKVWDIDTEEALAVVGPTWTPAPALRTYYAHRLHIKGGGDGVDGPAFERRLRQLEARGLVESQRTRGTGSMWRLAQ